MAQDSTMSQDYVKAIYSALEWGGEPLSVTGLAQRMKVAPSTASENVRRLAHQGLVEHLPYRGISLSEEGRSRALTMVRRHRLLETFLYQQLGYDWDEVHDEADSLEHAVSDHLVDRLDEKLGFPACDPHGDPIPRGGKVEYPHHILLADMTEGQTASVMRIADADPQLLRFAESVGIAPGVHIRVIERQSYSGTIGICIDDGDAQYVGDLVAQAVWMRAASASKK